jgi:hypothetical protein
VLDRTVEYRRRGVPALIGMLLDVGVAAMVVDYAVQVDVAKTGALLGTGLVPHSG